MAPGRGLLEAKLDFVDVINERIETREASIHFERKAPEGKQTAT